MKSVFLAQRIDFADHNFVIAVVNSYREVICGLPIRVVAMADELLKEDNPTDRELVENSYRKLDACDFMILDMTEENWTYIGCIFEVSYFFRLGRPIIVNVGGTRNGQRPWLRFHATKIVTSGNAVRECLSNMLGGTDA